MTTWIDLSGAELRARLKNRATCTCSDCEAEIYELVRRREDPRMAKLITAYLKKRPS